MPLSRIIAGFVRLACCAVGVLAAGPAYAETVFLEAETFQSSSSGWSVVDNRQTQRASRLHTLWGADGPLDAVASKNVSLRAAGRYRVWVRYLKVGAWRGPFDLAVAAGDKEIASRAFDVQADPQTDDWDYTWQSLEADLPAGDITLRLAKHGQANCSSYVRHVDCLLLTTDQNLVPSHVPFGPQTLLRVTLGDGYDRPAYMHLFVDHYRAPWYAGFAIGRDGIHEGTGVPAEQMLQAGDTTAWCNLSPTVYQDTGAALNLSVRHTYTEKASRIRAKLEFGRSTTAEDSHIEVVKTFHIDIAPNGLVIIVPPDLATAENIALLRRDLDFANETGRVADATVWPTHGKRPETLPFLVTANIGGYNLEVSADVTDRERKTLDYFGFNGDHGRLLGGLWHMKEDSYCRPDVDAMRERVKRNVEEFHQSGRKLEDVVACLLMDEPTGQPAAFAAKDEAYCGKFREWLRNKGLTSEGLGVANWEELRPVPETERDAHPALHYYTQLFRTRALGDFMTTQRHIIEDGYGRSFPTVVNFSDGAVYYANFCGQGVDYFELLDSDDQNAIWGEDWANGASTYQCGAFNVALMQAAARKRGQAIGHYLIAHAGRTAWDTKLKAIGETARGVRMWCNFSYGPSWGTHEGGPAWRSHVWYAKPELWRANAEITREVGAVEDWLATAKPAPAEVAIVYSSASDIWTMWNNLAFGFDRMHTWLALAHAQIPVDIVSEREVAAGQLAKYKVCYLSGPNLTKAAAVEVRAWVEAGGTLCLTAGAASRDEFNRPLDTLDSLLPADRADLETLEPFQNSGRYLNRLAVRDSVLWGGAKFDVLSVRQFLVARNSEEVLARFSAGAPAVVRGRAGKGRVIQLGFLPALSYIKSALDARLPLEQQASEQAGPSEAGQPAATAAAIAAAGTNESSTGNDGFLERSYNPWDYPADTREMLLTPVRAALVIPPLTCDTPLVDAVVLSCEQGALVMLANYTLRPLDSLTIQVRISKTVDRVESVQHGLLDFERPTADTIRWRMPLGASDCIKVWFK